MAQEWQRNVHAEALGLVTTASSPLSEGVWADPSVWASSSDSLGTQSPDGAEKTKERKHQHQFGDGGKGPLLLKFLISWVVTVKTKSVQRSQTDFISNTIMNALPSQAEERVSSSTVSLK